MNHLPKYASAVLMAPASGAELSAEPEGRIAGYASTWGGAPDRVGDVVQPGAFTATLAEHRAAGTLPVMLWCHAMERPVRRWTVVGEDATGLQVEGMLNLETAAGREAFAHVRDGDVTGLSIGYTIPEGGRTYRGGGVFDLSRVELHEISLVALPCNSLARIASAKSLGTKAQAVELLRAAGLSRKAAARFAAGGWPALAGDDHHDKAQELARRIDGDINRMRTP
jgi:HK97 family phage prohead protease